MSKKDWDEIAKVAGAVAVIAGAVKVVATILGSL
jgi:hypothetical protein